MKDWKDYGVGEKSITKGWINPDCQPLVDLSHVTHLDHAYSIITRGTIQPGLVFDKSKLNQERILVSWFSPNYWRPGSRYGNVSFDIDFKSCVAEMNYYWVEVMTEYEPYALRFLITPYEYNDLEKYNPTKGDGPWYYDKKNDEHFWNGDYCLEFMFEMEIPLSLIKSITFVDHHTRRCNIKAYNCGQKGLSAGLAKDRFFAHILSHDYPITLLKLTQRKNGKTMPLENLKSQFRSLASHFAITKYAGNIVSNDDLAIPQLKSFFHFRAIGDYKSANTMLSTFSDAKESTNTLIKFLSDRFDLNKQEDLYS